MSNDLDTISEVLASRKVRNRRRAMAVGPAWVAGHGGISLGDGSEGSVDDRIVEVAQPEWSR